MSERGDARKARLEKAGEIMSKEGKVTGHLGNHEHNPFEPVEELREKETNDDDDGEPTLKCREGDQPLPLKNSTVNCQKTFLNRMRADVMTRRQVGIQRYGTALQPFNQRDAMRDAWEEYIDLGQYIEQLRRERDVMVGLLKDIITYGGTSENIDNAASILHGLGIDTLD